MDTISVRSGQYVMGFAGQHFIVQDVPSEPTSLELQKRFDAVYRAFLVRLQKFHDSHRAPTAHEERELTFMMDALIAAKQAAER